MEENSTQDINWALAGMIEAMQESGYPYTAIYQVRNKMERKLKNWSKEKGAEIYEEWS